MRLIQSPKEWKSLLLRVGSPLSLLSRLRGRTTAIKKRSEHWPPRSRTVAESRRVARAWRGGRLQLVEDYHRGAHIPLASRARRLDAAMHAIGSLVADLPADARPSLLDRVGAGFDDDSQYGSRMMSFPEPGIRPLRPVELRERRLP